MCELNLVTLQCVTVKLLSILLVTDCLSDASALRSMNFVQSGGKLVFRKKSLVSRLLHHYERKEASFV